MSTANPDDKVVYLLTVLKNTVLAKPDYAAVAVEAGINTSNNAQRRFRGIVQKAGFDLVGDQIVCPDGTTGGGTPVATPAKKSRAKKANGPAATKTPAKKTNGDPPNKKRKLSQPTVESDSDEDDKPVKQEVKEEVDDEVEADENDEDGDDDDEEWANYHDDDS